MKLRLSAFAVLLAIAPAARAGDAALEKRIAELEARVARLEARLTAATPAETAAAEKAARRAAGTGFSGKFQLNNQATYLTFRNNGTMSVMDGATTAEGTYFKRDGKLVMRLANQASNAEMTISGTNLTDRNGDVWKRVGE